MKAAKARRRTGARARTPMASRVASQFEVSREMTQKVMDDVLSRAYAASRSMPVVLLLRGLSPAEVDRRLDPLVGTLGINVHGIEYRVVGP